MKVLIVDNTAGDWRRVYVDRKLVAENTPARVQLPQVLEACGLEVVRHTVESFDMVNDD